MLPRGPLFAPLRLLATAAVLAAALAGCKDKPPEPPPPPKPAVIQPAPVPALTKEQAMAALLALPEVKTWSSEIEKGSRGKAHGAIIEDNPTPRTLNGKQYFQMSFVENRKGSVRRRESFLVAQVREQTGEQILVEDADKDTVLSLDEWRRQIRRVQLKSAD